jgi:murein DD-endopeptidase MepM/ murein hydrolase activator NlpD
MRIVITLATAFLSAATASATSGGGPGAGVVNLPPCDPSPRGTAWMWPLHPAPPQGSPASAPPSVLRPFEPPEHRWEPGHRGVDLAGWTGEPVVAAGAGVVLFAGRVVDEEVLVLGHGELRTSYEPVDAAVAVGDHVAAGQVVGTLAAGHCTGAACLHWGLLTGHGHAPVYYDPLLLLGCGAVRLEPLG